jgi:hypothetical protein
MSPDRMRSLLDKSPFHPFTILKGDGEEVNVVARSLALLYPGGRTLHVVSPKFAGAKTEGDFEDHFIDVFLITDVIQPARSRNGKNGKKKHR